ncbi:nucleotide disphospho-sugar-binding domain-containing protein [Streptomyces sp. NPDC050619]|uniref:nucleotide disphospho-sugar-binding domain-containing protein n=1 Tax=Streptomyces sp. NPDC050619 TaxID=3157214 RepID=UPI0034416CF6
MVDDQDDRFVVGEANHQVLSGRVAAVVHHGGAGTTTTATRSGAPQVAPQLADQPYWAGRVADLGVGVAHDGPTPTFESLSAALKAALAPRDDRTDAGHGRHGPRRRQPRSCSSTRSEAPVRPGRSPGAVRELCPGRPGRRGGSGASGRWTPSCK